VVWGGILQVLGLGSVVVVMWRNIRQLGLIVLIAEPGCLCSGFWP